MSNKKNKQLCKNCGLFNAKEGVCNVVMLHINEHYELPMSPNDECFWIQEGFVDDIQQIRVWSDGEDGYIEHTKSDNIEDIT